MNISRLIAAVAAATIALAAPGHAGANPPSAAPTTVPTIETPTGHAPTAPSATPAAPPPRAVTPTPKAPVVRASTKTPARARTERSERAAENADAPATAADTPDAPDAPAAAARPVVVTRARVPSAVPKVRAATGPRAGAGAVAAETSQRAATDATATENDDPKATTEMTAARPDLNPPMRGLRQRMMDEWKTAWQRTKSFTSTVIHHPQRYHIGAAIIAGLNIGAAIFIVATTGDFVTAINLVTAAATVAGAGALLHKFMATVDPSKAGKETAATHETAPKATEAPTGPVHAGPAPGAATVPVSQVKRVYNFLANKADKADGSLFDASTGGGAVQKATVNQLPGDAKTVAGDLPGAQAYVMQVKGEAYHVVSARIGASKTASTTAFVFGPDGALIASGKTTKDSPSTITWDDTPTMPEVK